METSRVVVSEVNWRRAYGSCCCSGGKHKAWPALPSVVISFDVQTLQDLRPGCQIFQFPVPKFSLSSPSTGFWIGMSNGRGMSLTESDCPKGLNVAGSREAGEASWKCSREQRSLWGEHLWDIEDGLYGWRWISDLILSFAVVWPLCHPLWPQDTNQVG